MNYFILATGVEHYITTIGYAGIIIWFMTLDQLTPIPEEVSLVTIGYLIARGILNAFLAGLISFASLVLIDIVYYYLSRAGSKFIKKRIKKESGFIAKYKEKLRKHMGKTVLTLCFIPRMRYWCPILIGSMNLQFKRFILFDSIGLGIFILVYIGLGYAFHASLHTLLKKVEGLQNMIFFSSIGIFAIILTIIIVRRGRKDHSYKKHTVAH